MSDELSIQQQRPSATPYVLGGAALGAVGGGVTAKMVTKPQYESFEELVKEKEDSFKKVVDKAIEDSTEKEKAINAYKKVAEAGENWDKEFEAYKNDANKAVDVVPDENYKNLEKELEAKKSAVEAKRAELVKAEVEKLKANNVAGTKAEATLADSLRHRASVVYHAGKDKAKLAEADKELKAFVEKAVDKLEYVGTPAEVKVAKEQAKKQMIGYVQELVGQKELIGVAPTTPKVVQKHSAAVAKKAALEASIKNEVDNAYKSIDATIGSKNFRELYQRDSQIAAKNYRRHASLEKNNLQKLNNFKDAYLDITSRPLQSQPSIKDIFKALWRGEKIALKPETTVEDMIKKYTDGMSAKQKASFEKLLGGKLDEKTINAAIKKSEDRLNLMSSNWNSITGQSVTIERAKAGIAKANEDLAKIADSVAEKYGEGAHIENGKILTKEGKVVKLPKPKFGAPKIEFSTNTIVPENLSFEYVKNAGTALTEEQIAQKAKEAVTDAALKTEIDAQKAAQTALDEAKAKLPKATAKTEEELLEAFIKQKGGNREEIIKKAGEAAKDDLKALLEKRVSNKKIAGYAAAGAVALAGLGYLFAPKNKQV